MLVDHFLLSLISFSSDEHGRRQRAGFRRSNDDSDEEASPHFADQTMTKCRRRLSDRKSTSPCEKLAGSRLVGSRVEDTCGPRGLLVGGCESFLHPASQGSFVFHGEGIACPGDSQQPGKFLRKIGADAA